MNNKYPDVGNTIRNYRINQNLSLRELSKISELSLNALSKIERGENSPTVASLHKIASALNVHVSNFFVSEGDQTTIFSKKSETKKVELEGLIFEGLGVGLIKQRFEPFIITIPPGSENISDPSSHTGEEFIYCLEGQLEYNIANANYELSEGDSILFKASQPHSWQNKTNSVVKVIILFETDPNQTKPHSQMTARGFTHK